jgi:hypothetical protein
MVTLIVASLILIGDICDMNKKTERSTQIAMRHIRSTESRGRMHDHVLHVRCLNDTVIGICGVDNDGDGNIAEIKNTEINVDTINTVDISQKIPIPTPVSILKMVNFWKTTNPELTTSDRHMYGEPTGGTIYKIWQCINTYVKPHSNDVLLDWGMGAGKMLISKSLFATTPDMAAIGVEMDVDTFAVAKRNIKRSGVQNIRIFHRDSTTVTTDEWSNMGVSIVIQYDGGTSPDLEIYHQTIMTSLVNTECVRAIFSTKMNKSLFETYFHVRPLVYTQWSLYRIRALMYGRSRFMGHLWVRKDSSTSS